jgi:hypothetical protein
MNHSSVCRISTLSVIIYSKGHTGICIGSAEINLGNEVKKVPWARADEMAEVKI